LSKPTTIPKSEKDEAIGELTGLVKAIAQRMASRMPPHIDVDDLIGAGMIGLLDAFDKFDSAKSNNFKKYAEVRIKGAILDEVRAMDPMGRGLRRKANKLGKSQAQLEQALGRAPTPDEVAAHIGIEVDGYHKLVHQLQPILVVSVEELSDEGRDFSALLTDRLANDPAALLEGKRIRDFLDRMLSELKEKQGMTLRFYFYDGLTMREIAKILGVSESRASQLMDEALEAFGKRMRLALSRHGGIDVGPNAALSGPRTGSAGLVKSE
jgi:RNA polymerase sigma factor for flagellar operon FliA